MRLLGVTGGVGMGKSTTARFLREHGVEVIDTDEIAREVVEPGQPALGEIRRSFGADMVDEAGRLRRDRLAELVFRDEEARKRLERILHPRIRERWQHRVEQWKQQDVAVGAVIIPLLFETDAASCFDEVICVACLGVTQQARLRERGWSEAQIRQRLAAQWPAQRKVALSDRVVWTEGEVALHSEQVARIVRESEAA